MPPHKQPKLTRHQKRKLNFNKFTTNLKNNAITNLSSHTLSDIERDLLTKGLSYAPTYNHDTSHLQQYTQELIRRLRIDYHFKNKDNNRTISPHHTKSDWSPPIPLNTQINEFTNKITNLTHDYPSSTNTQKNSNELNALESLKQNHNITIKRADKGGSVVIMNTQDYIDKVNQHLNQPHIYAPQNTDNNKQVMNDLISLIIQLEGKGLITHEQAKYIYPAQPTRTPLIYCLTKTHKPDHPVRPIISGCDSPTDKLSKYLTLVFNPIARAQPSYLHGTKHFIQLIDSHPPLPEGAYLVTADVTSLYTNIPHDEGISYILHSLDTYRHTQPPILPPNTPNNTIIKQFLQLILKGNYFDFMNKHYLQIQGTAMGTKMAPPYANIFMANIEHQLTHNHELYIPLWKRFIDDIFFIWTDSLNKLKEFMNEANSLHPTIKFTFDYSQSTANFLDTTVYIDKQRKLQTTIYRKPTDKNLILHFTSHHPLHLKRNIIYSQALRYKRIISNPHKLKTELNTLKRIFIARGYPARMIRQQFDKITQIPRTQLLMNKNKTTPTQRKPLLKTPYNPHNHAFKEQVKLLWHDTITENTLKQLWPTTPAFIEVTDKKLMDTLVHTKQQPPKNTNPI